MRNNNLDELVFQQRNRTYGAYILRKFYKRNVAIGLLSAFFLSFLFCAIAWYNFYCERNKQVKYIDYSVSAELANINQLDLKEEVARKKKLAKEEIFIPGEIVDSVKEEKKEEIKKEVAINEADTVGSETGQQTNGTSENGGGVVYISAEKMPEFPGGKNAIDKYLQENMKIPTEIRQNKTKKGKIVVQVKFCVKNDGSIDMVSVYRSADPLLDLEAMRVVKSMPRWVPGMQGGEPVNVWCAIPIRFVL